ncbi:rhodanese-like domain-containing protein [Aldersonia kunmingensis]|uniref:rhodanese-like domain-containing protein n=1 Tax=Aldersonia kunmingensis TaxID=408066 RepID=UPI000833A6F8|nr:rhodanese-like domain-containing protein [Aldersonia kunmingensis]
MTEYVSGPDLFDLLASSDRELAVLDVRTPLERSKTHIAVSASLPFHDLEQRIATVVPHVHTSVVLAGRPDVDGAAAEVLKSLGYRDVRVLEDGIEGWAQAGGRLYTGTNVRSKTLGEWIEHKFHTPTVDSATVADWIEQGEDVVILDSRPTAEFAHHHIPGGHNTGGGAEIAYRAAGVIATADTKVVINCAGRTRGIVGAQSLINTGITNQIFSLYNGTPAWEQSGRPLAFGLQNDLRAPTSISTELAEWVRTTFDRAQVQILDPAAVQNRLTDTSTTTYVFDVRTPEEFAAGHFDVSVSAPGGQLVQQVDNFVAVRGAHIVLVDNGDFVRAASTVQWLRYLHTGPVTVVAYEPNSALTRPHRALEVPDARYVSWAQFELWRAGDTELRVIDLRSSADYAAGHIPGSVHARREHLVQEAEKAPNAILVLVGNASYKPEFVASAVPAEVAVLDGGIDAAADVLTDEDPHYAGAIADRTGPPPFGPERDRWYAAYFEWELALLENTDGDPHFDFEKAAS